MNGCRNFGYLTVIKRPGNSMEVRLSKSKRSYKMFFEFLFDRPLTNAAPKVRRRAVLSPKHHAKHIGHGMLTYLIFVTILLVVAVIGPCKTYVLCMSVRVKPSKTKYFITVRTSILSIFHETSKLSCSVDRHFEIAKRTHLEL